MKWQTYNRSDLKHLSNKVEVKTNDGKTHSIWNVVGASILKKDGSEIDFNEIMFWREKQDFNHFNTLQRYNQVLENFDLFELEDVLTSVFAENFDETTKLFEDLRDLVESAQIKLINESKKYL